MAYDIFNETVIQYDWEKMILSHQLKFTASNLINFTKLTVSILISVVN